MQWRPLRIARSIWFVCLLCFVLSSGRPPTPAAAAALPRFKDVASTHWAYSAIQEGLAKGIISGYEDSTFRPDRAINQAELMSLVFNSYPDNFTYMGPPGRWFEPYYAYAETLGLTYKNVNPNSFTFTRGDLARFLVSLLFNEHQNERDAVVTLLDAGLTSGVTAATYDGYQPRKTLTRAEALTFIFRIEAFVEGSGYPSILAAHGRNTLEIRPQPAAEHGTNQPTASAPATTAAQALSQDFFAGTAFSGVKLGDSAAAVRQRLGPPDRIDDEYANRQWHTYNRDYTKYVKLLIGDDRVLGAYTNALDVMSGSGGVTVGAPLERVKPFLGRYISSLDGYEFEQTFGEYRLNFWLDNYTKDKAVDAVAIFSDYLPETAVDGPSSLLAFRSSPAYIHALERGVFDITNAFRVKHGQPVLLWDELAHRAAAAHSADMAKKDYFDHTNLDGLSPFDRMEAVGIRYSAAGENIASGYADDMAAVAGWVDSSGHRSNMLDDYTYLGVGVSAQDDTLYYTQNFYSPY